MVTDNTCGLCGMTRTEHQDAEAVGQIHHKFTAGESLSVSPSAQPRKVPPTPFLGMREDQALLKLIMVLTEKGILDGGDLERILGGKVEPRATDPGNDRGASQPDPQTSPSRSSRTAHRRRDPRAT